MQQSHEQDSPAHDRLGTGWAFPPSFDQTLRSVVLVSDAEHIRQGLWLLFSTKLGERVMHGGYGTDLRRKADDGIAGNRAGAIAAMLRDAITAWEPRIEVEDLSVVEVLAGEDEWHVSLRFVVGQDRASGHFTYLFSTREPALQPLEP
jgi:phage baseplate assembly protein W